MFKRGIFQKQAHNQNKSIFCVQYSCKTLIVSYREKNYITAGISRHEVNLKFVLAIHSTR